MWRNVHLICLKKIKLSIESSTLAIFISFFVGLLIAVFFYFADKKIEKTAYWLKLFLISSRFLVLGVVIFLLFSPLTISQKEKIKKPILPVLVDNSKSIFLSDSSFVKDFNTFEKHLKESLTGVDIKIIPFSSKLRIGDSLNFKNQGSNISSALENLNRLFPRSNIGAGLLISDGIVTQGQSNSIVEEYPIYSIGVGDSTLFPDARIKKIFHNDIVFMGNEFSVETALSFDDLVGEPQTILLKFKGDVFSKKIYTPVKKKDFLKFKSLVKANESGVFPLEVFINSQKIEKFNGNNHLTHYINVKEKKQKVLLVNDFSHPDVRLVKSALYGLDHIELKSTNFNDLEKDCSELNAVIFVGNSEKESHAAKWMKKLKDCKVGFIWITGVDGTFKNEFLKFVRLDNSNDNVSLLLNSKFSLFKIKESLIETLQSNQRISMPFGKWIIQGESVQLASQLVNGVATNYDAVAFSSHAGVSFCVMFGEGYWRYGLRGAENMTSFFRKAIDVVSVHIDDSKIKILGFDEFIHGEEVSFEANYYNQSNQLDNSFELNSKLYLNDSLIQSSKFLKTDSAYRSNFGKLSTGLYALKVELKIGEQSFQRQKRFTIKELKVESENLVANFNLLREISINGTFNFWEDRNKTVSDLLLSKNFKSVSYFESIIDLLIKQKWIFYTVVSFLSLEWFIRKWQGTI